MHHATLLAFFPLGNLSQAVSRSGVTRSSRHEPRGLGLEASRDVPNVSISLVSRVYEGFGLV